jgi:tRNA modification GTPase
MTAASTIFALSSGAPPAALAVIRLSGPDAHRAAAALCGTLPPARQAAVRLLRDPATGEVLDQALVIIFAKGHSATGEAMAELHCHGGRAVVAAVLTCLSAMPGLRAAEPGAFTRRALEAGRMDLNAVEGLSDLLAAETEGQRRAALAMVDGRFGSAIAGLQTAALRCAALVEAALDFEDEADVADADPLAMAQAAMDALAADLATLLAAPPAERLRDGIRLVIAGPVNSGKSTLLNALAGRDAAIVTDIAGTTRDRIEVPVALDGVAYLLTDTAGLRDDADDAVERIGMDRARSAMAEADLLLWLGAAEEKPRPDALTILSRCDHPATDRTAPHDLALSVHSGEGMHALRQWIAGRAAELLPTESAFFLSRRQRDALHAAEGEVRSARAGSDPLIAAEHLRAVLGAFDRLTGRAATEEMLDALFSGFCVGK